MKNYIIILIGLPASGKSYWVENYAKGMSIEYTVLSTDNIIEKVAALSSSTYSEVFKDSIDNVIKQMFGNLKVSIFEKENIIIDRTNLTKKSRKKILDMVPNNYMKTAIVFQVDDETQKQRLANRPGKDIPDYVIEDMKKRFEYPTIEEGFDIIVDYKND